MSILPNILLEYLDCLNIIFLTCSVHSIILYNLEVKVNLNFLLLSFKTFFKDKTILELESSK